MNPMKQIRIEKLTLNVGAGKDQKLLEKGQKLLKNITGVEPVQTITQKRIPSWGLRPGLPIGCKITLRGEEAEKLIARLVKAKDDVLKANCFDKSGNISFGIPECIDIPETEYDPEIGIIGLQVSITLTRPGYRVKKRSNKQSVIGKSHLITQEDAIGFFKEKFNISVGE